MSERHVQDERIPLVVPEGQTGLRQNDAYFQHGKNLPELIGRFESLRDVAAIAVSSRPRSVEGSYMPCFMAGVSLAKCLSSALSVKVFEVSHQEGHLAAAIYSSGRTDLFDKSFCAWHVSGGTTELLKVEPSLRAEVIGGTNDSSAGQIIDRVGKRLGLPFPAGPSLEKLAEKHKKELKRKLTVKGSVFSLSGLENQALRFIEEGLASEDIAFFVLKSIADVIEKASDTGPYQELLCCGGVMSNAYIKSRLPDAVWASKETSSDNAVGAAFLAKTFFERGKASE